MSKFNFNKNEARKSLGDLIDRFKENYENYKEKNYNESACRLEFIDKLLIYFGWDVYNEKGVPPISKEVIVESYEQELGKPDYTLRFNGLPKIFVEAKKPNVDIIKENEPAFQIRRYGWNAKHKIAILTNFETLSIYECSAKPNINDKSNVFLIKRYNYTEYVSKYEEIYNLISRENIYNGKFDLVFDHIKPIGPAIDEEFLYQINEWRLRLGQYLFDIGETNIVNINNEVQDFINQIIFLRICEDRNLPLYKTLQRSLNKGQKLQNELVKVFKMADTTYNSGLFKGTNLINFLNQTILQQIIAELYYPISPYDFTIIGSNILGEVYEAYIAQTLMIEDSVIKLRPKKENENKAIVTTPIEVVRFMVDFTIGNKIKGLSPDEIKNMNFLDIACGSGIFLTEVFNYIVEYCENWYIENKVYENHLVETYTNVYKLSYYEKREILEKCIYGIDIDYQATKVAKFSLLLKLLEGETKETVFSVKPILPTLDDNIFNGNSLIDFSMTDDSDSEELISLKPFDWNKKYDVIIGNPPYVKTEDMRKILTSKEFELYLKYYNSSYKQFDKYFLFIERAIQILNKDGYVCYIVPNKFAKNVAGQKLREIIVENKFLKAYIDFNYQQIFNEKTIYSCILLLSKENNKTFLYDYVKDYNEWKITNMERKYYSIKNEYIKNNIWLLSDDKITMENLKKLFDNSVKLCEIATPFNGVQTSKNDVYIITGKEIIKEESEYITFKKNEKEYSIEKAILKKYFQPIYKNEKNLNSFSVLQTDKYIIFPYSNGDLVNLERFPLAKKYLEDNYEKLAPKQVIGNKKGARDIPNATKDTWYQYGRTQALTEFEGQDKLIVGVMTKEPMFIYDNDNLVIQSGGTAGYCGIKVKEDSKYDLNFLQAYLSHPILTKAMECMGSNFEGGFFSRGTQVLNNLPIIKVDFENKAELEIYNYVVEQTKKINMLSKECLKNKSVEEINSINVIKNQIISNIMLNISKLIGMKE